MSNRIYKFSVIILMLFVLINNSFAEKTIRYKPEDKKLPEYPRNVPQINQAKRWKMNEYQLPWITTDTNKDGQIDSAAKLSPNKKYRKLLEVLDTNYDGQADDFTFYDLGGKIVYQEIDSNFDKRIDLWINILDGKYLKRFQKDSNHDGYIDIDRDFTK